ncbi:MAG: DJ-1/PfpI family protein [Myxococcota bacterium]
MSRCIRGAVFPLLVLTGLARLALAAPPLVAVVAHNDGTETTDFLVPFNVLSRAGVGQVVAVSLRAGPVELHPALAIEVDETLADFDARHPNGADFVIVPAVIDPEAPALRRWLREQAKKGATLVSICDGAWVLAHAGVLDGRAATTHWYSRDSIGEQFPNVRWARDRRWLDAGSVVSTTGVSASIPVSLALIERIAGRERALAVASSLGVGDWDPAHDSDAFGLSAGHVWTAARNGASVWSHERVGIPVADGVDEASLALVADALARTWRSTPVALASAPRVMTRYGLRLATSEAPVDRTLALPRTDSPAVPYLEFALADIERHYGAATADFVALQLEYARAGHARAAR